MRSGHPGRGDHIAWTYPDGAELDGVITRITKDGIYIVKIDEDFAALVQAHHITGIIHQAISR